VVVDGAIVGGAVASRRYTGKHSSPECPPSSPETSRRAAVSKVELSKRTAASIPPVAWTDSGFSSARVPLDGDGLIGSEPLGDLQRMASVEAELTAARKPFNAAVRPVGQVDKLGRRDSRQDAEDQITRSARSA